MNVNDIQNLPEQERNELLIAAVQFLNQSIFQPLEVFEASLKFRPTTYAEIINVHRELGQEDQVLLSQRPADDLNWPNQWHSPGKFLRKGWTIADVLKHLYKADEIGAELEGDIQFAGVISFPKKQRGHAITLVFARVITNVDSLSLPANVKLFPVSSLSTMPDIIAAQRDVIIPHGLRALSGVLPQYVENGENDI